MENFKIKIPVKFKEQLEQRFSYENRKIGQKTVYIPHSCPSVMYTNPTAFSVRSGSGRIDVIWKVVLTF